MSKEAALRAMREARHSKKSAGSTPAWRPAGGPAKPRAADPASSAVGLCGHRSMNGRTCTRENGHEAKSHRYS